MKSTYSKLLWLAASVPICWVSVSQLGPHGFVFLAATVCLCAILVSFWLERTMNRQKDSFSVLRIVGYNFLSTGVLGFLYLYFNFDRGLRAGYGEQYLLLASTLTTGTWIAISFGYLSGRRWYGDSIQLPTLLRNLSVNYNALIAVFTIGWIARFFRFQSGRYFHLASDVSALERGPGTFILITLSDLPEFCLLIFLVISLRSGVRKYRWLAGLGLASEFVWAAPVGARAAVISLILSAVVACYYANGRTMPIRGVIIGVLVALPAFPIIDAYRSSLASESPRSVGYYLNYTVEESGGFTSAIFDTALGRFVDLDSTAAGLSNPEQYSEVLGGERFVELAVSALVPRALWPDKPDPALVGNEFGRASGIVAFNDQLTSIVVPWPLMLYLAGGLTFVLVGGLIIGFALQAVNLLFRGKDASPATIGVYAFLSFSILQAPSTVVQNGLFGLVKTALSLVIVLLVVRSRNRSEEYVK